MIIQLQMHIWIRDRSGEEGMEKRSREEMGRRGRGMNGIYILPYIPTDEGTSLNRSLEYLKTLPLE